MPRQADVEAIVAKHIDSIATPLRDLQRRLKTFSNTIVASSQTDRKMLPIRPVVAFEPQIRNSELIAFKELSTHESRIAAADAFSEIGHIPGDIPNQSVKCHAVLGVPRSIIQQAQAINRVKGELREALKPLHNRSVRIPGKNAAGKQTILRRTLITVVLRRIQSSHISPLAAYRVIPIATEEVNKVSFMLTRPRSVPRKTVAQLISLLTEMDRGQIADRDLNALENLVNQDPKVLNEYLDSPKAYYYRMRAWVYFRRATSAGDSRIQYSADLPILVPMGASTVEPIIKSPSPPKPDRKRPPSQISDEEIVQSLHYFRKKPSYRQYAESS